MDAQTKRHMLAWCKNQRCDAIVIAKMEKVYNSDAIYFDAQSWAVCWQHVMQELTMENGKRPKG